VSPAAIPYRAKATYDGRLYEFDVPDLSIPKCEACGELVFSNRVDDLITQAFRAHLRLLSDEQIRIARKRLGLSQKELAERLGMAEATISRWETGALLQSRAMDNLLRVFFACPEVRHVLCGAGQDPALGIIQHEQHALPLPSLDKPGLQG
jgi:putative zinc finger/helix-turn-helix YgiT family protein